MSNNSVKIRELTIGEGKPKICVSIVGRTTEEIFNQAREIVELNEVYISNYKLRGNNPEVKTVKNLEPKIDIVEWRVDFFDDVFKADIVISTLKKLRDILVDLPIIFTFRTSKEGGNTGISSNDYIQLNSTVACSKLADMIDVEAFSFADEDENDRLNILDCHNENINKTKTIQVNHKRRDEEIKSKRQEEINYKQEEIYMVCQVAQKLIGICADLNKQQSSNEFKVNELKENESKESTVKVICSYHDFEKTPSKGEITGRLIAMQKAGADVLKMAVMPECKEDVMLLLGATIEMNRNYAQKPIVTMSMGKLGRISRVMGQFTGSSITFGAIGTASAPGQIEVGNLNNILEELAELY